MTGRAIGCGLVGIIAFVGLGLYGLSLATTEAGCPDRLQWFDRGYLPVGTPQAEPRLDGGEAVLIGATFIGLTTRDVYGPVGSQASATGEDRPDELVLDCADGTFLAYRLAP